MKKILTFITLLASLPILSYSQTMYDALRYSQQYYDGTARSLGMGNALVSLGGDLGALSYNPAASGVYRYSEFAITPSVYTNLSHASYLGNMNSQSKSRFALSNVGWTGGFNTGNKRGLIRMNFAITANQTNNFTFRTSASGIENQSSYLASMSAGIPLGLTGNDLTIPEGDETAPFYYTDVSWASILAWNAGLIDTKFHNNDFFGATENYPEGGHPALAGELFQDFNNERTGYIQDVVLNASGNISDILFVGVNLTLQSIYFSEHSSFTESSLKPELFETGFEHFTSSYRLTTSGTGINVKAGFILRPVAGLSIGGSISTPTWMYLNDGWQESVSGYTEKYGSAVIDSPRGLYEYRITSPFKFNLGIGYTFGNFLAIGVDYERTDYSKITIADSYGSKSAFMNENGDISAGFKAVDNVRAGMEFRVIPAMSLRLGYNYYSSSDRNFDNSRHYASAGLGFAAKGGFFADIAYQQQCKFTTDSYTLYDPYDKLTVPVLSERYVNWKLLMTLGFRF